MPSATAAREKCFLKMKSLLMSHSSGTTTTTAATATETLPLAATATISSTKNNNFYSPTNKKTVVMIGEQPVADRTQNTLRKKRKLKIFESSFRIAL